MKVFKIIVVFYKDETYQYREYKKPHTFEELKAYNRNIIDNEDIEMIKAYDSFERYAKDVNPFVLRARR